MCLAIPARIVALVDPVAAHKLGGAKSGAAGPMAVGK